MSSNAAKEHTGRFLMVAFVFGLIVGFGLLLTLVKLNLPSLEAAVLATLGGFTLGAFVFRERSLTHSKDQMRQEHSAEIARLEKRIQSYYDQSLVCLAYFDASTLFIENVSSGFLQLLRIPPEQKLGGKSIVELLHVSPSDMEAIVSEAQGERSIINAHRLVAEDFNGRELPIEVTVEYFKETHMVEASFFATPLFGRENSHEADMAQKDLDRFRRGMYRRETRILELKDEVNAALQAAGRQPRYRFDQKTQDTHAPTEKTSESEEGW